MTAEHKPSKKTKETALELTGLGVPQESIARALGIDEKTLRKHYREELDHGVAEANQKVANSLYQKAMNGDTTAAIFWMKTRAKWSENTNVTLTGKDDGPVEVKHFTGVPRPEDFTPEVLKAITQQMQQKKPDAS